MSGGRAAEATRPLIAGDGRSALLSVDRSATVLRDDHDDDPEHHETERVKSAVFQGILNEIDKLPRQRKAILRLYFFEQKSTAEIAKQLGLNSQTVLNHKAKALESLRKSGTKFKGLLEGVTSFVLVVLVLTFYLLK